MSRGSEFLVKVFLFVLMITSCSSKVDPKEDVEVRGEAEGIEEKPTIYQLPTLTGADQTELYLPLLQGKRVGVVGNQTSVVGKTHLVDTLISSGIDVKIVFSPEHGFRGDHSAGANVKHGIDEKTGLTLFSLHGKTKKPSVESLKDVDVILFDIQDVGARFYTYISTLHYVMEAAAENDKEVIVLDRPNPNAHYIDGPILKKKFKSFVGMHPVPVVYGMSIGEYGKMINGEFWLKDSAQAKYRVIPCANWKHDKPYDLPIAPSPNLPTQQSIYLYPSLCFFEGTVFSVGRGTEFPFEVYGHPSYTDTSFSFTPVSMPGKSKYPKNENKQCFGVDLRAVSAYKTQLDFSYIYDAYTKNEFKGPFVDREDFFNLLCGTDTILNHIKSGGSKEDLRNIWEAELQEFKKTRSKYLIY